MGPRVVVIVEHEPAALVRQRDCFLIGKMHEGFLDGDLQFSEPRVLALRACVFLLELTDALLKARETEAVIEIIESEWPRLLAHVVARRFVARHDGRPFSKAIFQMPSIT